MTMSGKRKSLRSGDDKIGNSQKKRKETEDDEDIMIVENTEIKEDAEAIRKKWTRKYLVFLKEHKGDTNKLRHIDLLNLLMDHFISAHVHSHQSSIANLKRELDKSNKIMAHLKAQNAKQQRHIQKLEQVVNTLCDDIKKANGFPRPLIMHRSVGLQVSSTECDTKSPKPNKKDKEKEIKDKELARLLADLESGPSSEPAIVNHSEEKVLENHFQENWPETRPAERVPETSHEVTEQNYTLQNDSPEPNRTLQNDRVSPELENPASPEVDVEGLDDDGDSDSYYSDSDHDPPGSPEGMPELDHQPSDSEEPTMEKIADQETTPKETTKENIQYGRPPVQHVSSDDDSDLDSELIIYKDPRVGLSLPESGLIEATLPESTEEDVLKEITEDVLREFTPEELNRVLSSCDLINPNDLVNDLNGDHQTTEELAVNGDVSSKLTKPNDHCDRNQNFIQAKTQTDFVSANDRIPQAGSMQVPTNKDYSDKTTPEPFDGCVDKGRSKSLLIVAKTNPNLSPEEQEKENAEPQRNQILANTNRDAVPCNVEIRAPNLCAITDEQDVVLTWSMPDEVNRQLVKEFEIIYTYDSLKNELSEWKWQQIAVIRNNEYPVACKVGSFTAGQNYCFSVRAVGMNKQTSPYSNVCKIKI